MPVGDEEKMGRPKGGSGGIPMEKMPVIMEKYVPIVTMSRKKRNCYKDLSSYSIH